MSVSYVTKIQPTLPYLQCIFLLLIGPFSILTSQTSRHHTPWSVSRRNWRRKPPFFCTLPATWTNTLSRLAPYLFIQIKSYLSKSEMKLVYHFRNKTLKCTYNYSISLTSQGGHVELSKDSDDSWYGNVYLKKWFRTSKAIVLYLSDGTLQVQQRFKQNYIKSRDFESIVTWHAKKFQLLCTFKILTCNV